MTPTHDDDAARTLKRLAVAADERHSHRIRVAAARSVLSTDHPLRSLCDLEFAERLTHQWDVRPYLESGRRVERRVSRPPVSLRDVLRG
jgi:hypothetical protein